MTRFLDVRPSGFAAKRESRPHYDMFLTTNTRWDTKFPYVSNVPAFLRNPTKRDLHSALTNAIINSLRTVAEISKFAAESGSNDTFVSSHRPIWAVAAFFWLHEKMSDWADQVADGQRAQLKAVAFRAIQQRQRLFTIDNIFALC